MLPGNQSPQPPILVTGGAGYIGSQVCKTLAGLGYEPIVYDNLSTGHEWAVKWGPLVKGDLADTTLLRDVIRSCRIERILHFAASAIVSESIREPHLYFRNNIAGTISLLDAALSEGVRQIVFSSTCATYGDPLYLPMTEEHPQTPISPYGESKLAIERLLAWHSKLSGLRAVILRYFNAAGADPAGELGEEHDPETHLVARVLMAAAGDIPALPVFGDRFPTPDGTAIRDYVHVADLADAHVRALQYLQQGGESVAMNLGTGTGVSVRSVIQAVERNTGCPVPVALTAAQPGDPAELVADNRRAREVLGWIPRYSGMDNIVQTAWAWKTRHRLTRMSADAKADSALAESAQ